MWFLNWIGCSSPTSDFPTPSSVNGSILLTDSSTVAGSPLLIIAKIDLDTIESPIWLIWSNAFGDLFYQGEHQQNGWQFSIPDSAFNYSGIVELSLSYQGTKIDQKRIQILPQKAFGIIESYAGAKTMVVNSRQSAMVVAIPKDTFGNAMLYMDSVQFRWRYPKATAEEKYQLIRGMTAAISLPSGSNSGKILTGATLGQSKSVEETIELTPGWPQTFQIEVSNWFPFADSRQLVTVQSGIITDRNGNQVADGTSIQFIVRENGKVQSRYRSFTSNGSAQVYIENPDHATSFEVFAMAEGGASSNTFVLTFDAAVQQLPFAYDQKQQAIVIGPITGNLGQMISDGLSVSVQLKKNKEGFRFVGRTENGFCTIVLSDKIPEGSYQCEVLAGGKQTVEIVSITK